MFRIELVWTDDAEIPEGFPEVLGEINVPALPPEGSMIRLRSEGEHGGIYFAVEVDGHVLFADNPGATNIYVVEVTPYN